MALYHVGLHDTRHDQIALKLTPDWTLPRFWVSLNRAGEGQCDQARALLHAGQRLNSATWWSFYTEGYVDLCEKDWAGAVVNFDQCLELKAGLPDFHFALACALTSEGDFKRAREEYRAYLRFKTEPEKAEVARDAVARINDSFPE